MQIHEIYERYRIMPSLQLHMLRVAAVAQLITEELDQEVDSPSVITACLLHDMGNIIKFDLDRFPDFLEPEGRSYWEAVKADFIARYGLSPSVATAAICYEVGVAPRIVELIASINFSEARKNYLSPELERKICAYADMRVAPKGVTSLQERLDDARERYRKPNVSDERHNVMRIFLERIQEQLVLISHVSPLFINESAVEPLFSHLEHFEVVDVVPSQPATQKSS